jgi:hypothetical protein
MAQNCYARFNGDDRSSLTGCWSSLFSSGFLRVDLHVRNRSGFDWIDAVMIEQPECDK